MATDPTYPWLPLDVVLDELGLKDTDPQAAAAERSRVAAAAAVEEARADLITADVFTPRANVLHGALMLAARLHARRGSPTGVVAYSELGGSTVVRFDSDIEKLLGTGRYARPRIG